MYAVDLHTHTRFFHGRRELGDRFDPVGYRLLAAAARLRGLDGVATTNHDYYTAFPDALGTTALPGTEITTTRGHLLVVGPDPPAETDPGELTPEAAVEAAESRGCGQQAVADGVEAIPQLATAVEEPRVGVQVDGVHVRIGDRNTFLFFDTNRANMQEPGSEDPRRVVVFNPISGSEDHADHVRGLADEHGFEVRETSGEGDAPRMAAEAAAEGAEFVAAAGGDGTLNEVVNGLYGAEALGDVTVGVVPAGTGNNFASKLGVESIDHAFEVFADGERRNVDLGVAAGRAFVNSCVGGITAEASAETTPESKRNLGVMAYVLNTVRQAVAYEGIPLTVETRDADPRTRTWSGEAAFVLVGNGRRFPVGGDAQADMEDGLLEVTIIEDAPAADVVGEAARERLFGDSGDHIHRLVTPTLTVRSADDDPISFSLDGEMITSHEADIEALPGRLTMPVGAAYDPNPDAGA